MSMVIKLKGKVRVQDFIDLLDQQEAQGLYAELFE